MSHTDAGIDLPSIPEPERGRRRLRDRRALLVTLGLLLVLAVGATVGVIALRDRLDSNIERIADPFGDLTERPPRSGPTDAPVSETALNILLLGSDSRISAGDPSQWEQGAQRTDAVMLIHLPADRESAYVMSIPRDSWVEIPGRGFAKINAAYSYGGPSLVVETVENLTGVHIDHFGVTDFESFVDITDELGGVLMTLKQDLVSNGEVVLPAGKHLMTGDQALIYVRQRMNLARGDFDRVQRQQAWIRAIFARMRNEQTLQNPVKSYPFLDAVTRSVAFDEGFTDDVMDDLVDRAKNLGSVDIGFFTVPIEGTGTSADGQSIVVIDDEPFAELMAAVRDDAVGAYVEANEDVVDVLPPVAP